MFFRDEMIRNLLKSGCEKNQIRHSMAGIVAYF